MKIASGNKTIEIEDRYISYSPYLSLVAETDVGVDVDEEGAIILDQPMSTIKQYVNFLEGKEFSMNEEVASFFEFMGHSNDMGYPLDYWKIKLQDNWIRDNFYKLDLVSDPYYGLIEIDKVRDIPHVEFNEPYLFVAGGAAMYMAGYIDDINDIDIFTTDSHMAINWANENYPMIAEGTRVITGYAAGPYKHQIIKRVYKSPSEVVHGFDLDCVGVIWDGKKLWATRRAVWSNENKTNWFDPERMSPSYIHRLIKYMNRGYTINTPYIDTISVNKYEVGRVWRSIWKAGMFKEITRHGMWESGTEKKLPIPKTMDEIKTYAGMMSNNKVIDEYKSLLSTRAKRKFYSILEGRNIVDSEEDINTRDDIFFHPIYLEHDPPSLLLMAIYYGIHLGHGYDVSDYEIEESFVTKVPRSSPWITIDPMQQLTGTFDPTSIGEAEDFISWLRSSPLVE